ncbi:DUF3800 domain-containing protein [Amycolatopsis eburnea]|uniref:DUF3800 domain-containing protein n=1 Tax=Amycolatopsis eburnea TaxID=2267691 RepID=A0A3R9EZ51_9PSEU|nr:DUF3800 domain-containing protein [Amycolatopsis eburnea]RSD26422.1 hypothetical protein EIY87_00080 [Amycolatopsis eburnea]
MQPPPQAFADESFHENTDGGFYVLAAAVLPADRHDELREAMLQIRGRRRGSKLHWYPMDHQEKLDVAKRIADFDELHVVTVGTPVRPRRQERGRALCLQRLVTELHDAGVGVLVAEARQADLNARDIATVTATRHRLPAGSRCRIEHRFGADEPLLWISDVVAGAVRARINGTAEFFDPLAGCVHEVQVDTPT